MVDRINLSLGFDIGSENIHYAVLDSNKKIVYSPKAVNHYARPLESFKNALEDVNSKFSGEGIKSTSFTGSSAEFFKEVIPNLSYSYDGLAIPEGVRVISPGADAIFHIGAKDAYFFSVSELEGKSFIRESRQSSKCGGGSGTLIAKQCRRLLEEDNYNSDIFSRAYELALKSKNPSEFLARCGIVIQSDLIHKQNEGVGKADNLAGLFQTVAKNYVIDVIGNRKFRDENVFATGGVMGNSLIINSLEEILGVKISRPEYFENVGAIGAAVRGMNLNSDFVFNIHDLEKLSNYGRDNRRFAKSLSLEGVYEKSESLEDKIEAGTEVVLGIDGGSTTTKGALVDLKTGNLLDKLYVSTQGDPVSSLKRVISYLSRHKNDVEIKGVATTGSARQLYQRILINNCLVEDFKDVSFVDEVIDEITCHALGVRHHDKDVEVIYEIGGQDMKYTKFNSDGTVGEAKMNFSCQAGGGQTLENMAQIIGLDVKSSLQEEAFKAKRIPRIDSTCGVFMEMDLNRLISEGFSQEELAAAIIYSTAESYYNKFVGGSSKEHGKKSSVQGGPALGNAFLAALSQVSGDKINAYPHRELFGAWGAALEVRKKIKELENVGEKYATAFRGWEVVDLNFEKEDITCKDYCERQGKRNCGVRDCDLENYLIGDDRIITGGFCPTGNSEVIAKPKKDYVSEFHKIVDRHFKKYGFLSNELDRNEKDSIGIRRCTSTVGEKGIWVGGLLNYLGFSPVLTPQSNSGIARKGMDNSGSEFCIARKLVTGHALTIKENPFIKYSFNPSFIHHLQKGDNPLKYCVYTESEGFLLNDEASLDSSLTINPLIEFGDKDAIISSFHKEFSRIGKKFSRRKIGEAIEFAGEVEENFRRDIYSCGDDFLEKMGIELAYVGIGRDYVLLDSQASSNSGEMFSRTIGLNYIPQTFLIHKFKDVSLEGLAEDEFWYESADILRAQKWVANSQNLYPIRLTNFGCGPDSIKLKQEKMIQDSFGKPMLELSTDGHTSNAPFITRTLAHSRVVDAVSGIK